MAARGEPSSRGSHPLGWLATELGARVVSAVVLAAVTLFVTFEGGWLFFFFWLFGGTAVLVEWVAMTRVEPRLPVQIVLGGGLGTLSVLQVVESPVAVLIWATGVALLVATYLAHRSRDRIWLLAGFAYAAVIALVPPLVRNHPELGLVGVLWMFAVVWTTDVAAYFVGRRFGGPKLWPRISPKKTWSGFAGGLAAGTLSGVAIAWAFGKIGSTHASAAGLVACMSALGSIVSQMGDLAESALKRKFDVKDSSRLIPGHGGVMDRLDGFWAVAALLGAAILAADVYRVGIP